MVVESSMTGAQLTDLYKQMLGSFSSHSRLTEESCLPPDT